MGFVRTACFDIVGLLLSLMLGKDVGFLIRKRDWGETGETGVKRNQIKESSEYFYNKNIQR